MNLENLGVQEMNTTELKQVEGGSLILIFACICLIAGIISGATNP